MPASISAERRTRCGRNRTAALHSGDRRERQPFHELAASLISFLYEDELERVKKSRQCATDLLQRIAERNDCRRFLLVVDQFEELYTLNADRVLARAFIAQLLAVQTEGFRAVITLRADFLEAALGDETFAKTLYLSPRTATGCAWRWSGLRNCSASVLRRAWPIACTGCQRSILAWTKGWLFSRGKSKKNRKVWLLGGILPAAKGIIHHMSADDNMLRRSSGGRLQANLRKTQTACVKTLRIRRR